MAEPTKILYVAIGAGGDEFKEDGSSVYIPLASAAYKELVDIHVVDFADCKRDDEIMRKKHIVYHIMDFNKYYTEVFPTIVNSYKLCILVACTACALCPKNFYETYKNCIFFSHGHTWDSCFDSIDVICEYLKHKFDVAVSITKIYNPIIEKCYDPLEEYTLRDFVKSTQIIKRLQSGDYNECFKEYRKHPIEELSGKSRSLRSICSGIFYRKTIIDYNNGNNPIITYDDKRYDAPVSVQEPNHHEINAVFKVVNMFKPYGRFISDMNDFIQWDVLSYGYLIVGIKGFPELDNIQDGGKYTLYRRK